MTPAQEPPALTGEMNVAELSRAPRARDDARMGAVVERFMRRVEATPPGDCPVATQLSLLQAGIAQTCGKCVPCRDGLPQLARMLKRVLACEAGEDELSRMRALAEMVRATSDCAIGYEAANALLEGMDSFAAEYESHVLEGRCQVGVSQTLPCETLCPAHVNVPGYIALVAAGRNADAVNMVRKDNPFPTACAFVCEHPCEERCRRILLDAPVNIRGIKKYAVDHAPADRVPNLSRSVDTARTVAVIGGGPSGLTCAHFLARMGHRVTVFEAREQLGGMMRYGIPAYRFPRERLDQDIRGLLQAGTITVRCGEEIDAERMRDIAGFFHAVYVAIGAQGGKTLRMDGADAEGVMSAVEMLGRIGDGDYPDFTGKDVVVVGGGNVAMDCARTSVRAGAASVTVVYRRRKEDMTALPTEVEAAVAEGVEMTVLMAPDSIEVDEAGHCTALIAQPQIDRPGQARPSRARGGEKAQGAHQGRRRAHRGGPGRGGRAVRGVRHADHLGLLRCRRQAARRRHGRHFRGRRLPDGPVHGHQRHRGGQGRRAQHRRVPGLPPYAALRHRRSGAGRQRPHAHGSCGGGRAPRARAQARLQGRRRRHERRGDAAGVRAVPALRPVRLRPLGRGEGPVCLT